MLCFLASGADFDKMKQFLLEVAGRLELDTNNLTVTDNAPDEESKQNMIEKFQWVHDTIPDGYFNMNKQEFSHLCRW